MPIYAQLVIGPAGSGKSTYCDTVRAHCEAVGRRVAVINLDPAAEDTAYAPAADVRDLITVEDAMEELGLGPNGALLYCMEFLEDSLDEWLGEEMAAFADDDYILFDCPGQVELYSHVPAFRTLADWLAAHDVRVAAVYCLDVQFAGEPAKFVAGCLAALAAMVQLELPHVNVLTKVDLLDTPGKRALRRHLVPDGAALAADLVRGGGGGAPSSSATAGGRLRRTYAALSGAVAALLDDWAMLSFVPLDRTGEGCGSSSDDDGDDDGGGGPRPPPDEGAGVAAVLAHIDHAIQFGEDAEVKVRDEREEEEDAQFD